MSGGVDSSVAAAWLKQQGYDVIGISLQLHDYAQKAENKFGTCCSLTDIGDARRVAEKFQFPFYVTDMEKEFKTAVIDDFVHEYLNGRTPNPCVRCNEKVKFHRLMDWAMDLGADYLATGHYADVRFDPERNEYQLRRGVDPAKDQSYFLFTLRQKDLARTFFPLGGLTKPQVRKLAEELGLAVANKPDSQEICFVQSRNYADFIEETVPKSLLGEGRILNMAGEELGRHTGLHQFTIGQRKGLGVNAKDPQYVVAFRTETRDVVIGPESGLFSSRCTVSNLNWIVAPRLDEPRAIDAKIRYRATESPVRLHPLLDNRVEVEFESPQRAITPGQALVFYEGGQVLGGGWIEDIPAPVV